MINGTVYSIAALKIARLLIPLRRKNGKSMIASQTVAKEKAVSSTMKKRKDLPVLPMSYYMD